MRLTHLSLTNFRAFTRLDVSFPPRTLILIGNNAQGKTSLLEAIYYLATSRSPHITADRQLISWLAEKEPMAYARLVAEVKALGPLNWQGSMRQLELPAEAGNGGNHGG